MYRLWIGVEERSLQRGPIYATLQEALERGYQFAAAYMVRIELGQGQWHVFPQTQGTILGPGFDVEQDLRGNTPSADESRPDDGSPLVNEASLVGRPPLANEPSPAAEPPAVAPCLAEPPTVDGPKLGGPPLADQQLLAGPPPVDVPPFAGPPPLDVPHLAGPPLVDEPLAAESQAVTERLIGEAFPMGEPPQLDEPLLAAEPQAVVEPLHIEEPSLPEKPPPVIEKPPLTLDERPPIKKRTATEPRSARSSSARRGAPTKRAPVRRTKPQAEKPPPERRRAQRQASPLPPAQTESVTWGRRPVRLVNVSWTGARVATQPHSAPHAGEVLVLEVRAFGLVAHLAGKVRWVVEGECGIAFDEALMTRRSTVLLERMLGGRN